MERRQPGAAVAVHLEVSFSGPGTGKVTMIDIGGDGSFQLPPNLNVNIGPLALFQVTSSFPPRGDWEVNSRMTDPTTGAAISEDINKFSIR